MYCSFCGKEIRDGAAFCSQCGKNQTTGKMKAGVVASTSGVPSLFKNKKLIGMLVVAVAIVFIIVIGVNLFGPKSIEGVWMDGTDRVSFSENGSFSSDVITGTYYIDDNKTLIIEAGEYSYRSGIWEYQYGKEAKEDDDYWYISGNKLYFDGGEYTKK